MKEENTVQTARNRKNSIGRIFHHRWIMKNIGFFLFAALLAVIYIYNGHYSDKTIRRINQVSRELKELQFEYKILKSDVMNQGKQSELLKKVQGLGLKELNAPPYLLGDSTSEKH